MRDEILFPLLLERYPDQDIEEFKTFLNQFRDHLNSLQPPPTTNVSVDSFRTLQDYLKALCNLLCLDGRTGRLDTYSLHCFYEPEVAKDPVGEMLAEGGHGNFVRALWTECMKPDLYRKAAVAWHRCGPQDLSQWQTLGRTAIDYLYSAPWPDAVFGEPETCPMCLLMMHRHVKTHSKSHEPCSIEPSATSPQPGPSVAKPTVAQWGTDPPRLKRSRSEEEKKPSKRSRTDEGKSFSRHTSLDATHRDPRSKEARPRDPRFEKARPFDPRSQEAKPCDPRSQEVRPRDIRSQEARLYDLRSQATLFQSPSSSYPRFWKTFPFFILGRTPCPNFSSTTG
ncbi:hypothetical protein NPIL_703521 [Nephila pilipes]|uniref:Uncharacterized protein n=1 Tax=Nephila pilipes TaxID=299642 RepID=A0A8X6MV02_NEPPI|nr:hypothetical protein NPIL_703521 [Nephila pilipes]